MNENGNQSEKKNLYSKLPDSISERDSVQFIDQKRDGTFVSQYFDKNIKSSGSTYSQLNSEYMLFKKPRNNNFKEKILKKKKKRILRSKKKLMSREEEKKLGMIPLSNKRKRKNEKEGENQKEEENRYKYESFLALNELWKKYIKDILNENNKEGGQKQFATSLKLAKCDYHGAIFTIERSKCPTLIGKSGIVLMETKNMFKIISKNNNIYSIPKNTSIFTFDVDGLVYTLHGPHFQFRPQDRASKVFKSKTSMDL